MRAGTLPGSRAGAAGPIASGPRERVARVPAVRVVRFLAAVCALCGVAAFPASALFDLQSVTVTGNAAVPSRELLREIGVGPGDNAFRVDAPAIRKRLLEDPRIGEVAVALAFPRRLVVSVRERDPVVALALGDGYVLLGADGVAIARSPTPGPRLPLVVDGLDLPWVQMGAAIPSADVRLGARVAATLPRALREDVAALRVDPDGEVVLETRDAVAIKVGGGAHLADRLLLAPAVLAAVRARGLRVEYVDLRFPGSVIVKPLGPGGTGRGAAATSDAPSAPGASAGARGARPAGAIRQENPRDRGIQPGTLRPVTP